MAWSMNNNNNIIIIIIIIQGHGSGTSQKVVRYFLLVWRPAVLFAVPVCEIISTTKIWIFRRL